MRLRLASLSACAHALFKHLDMLMGTCDAFTDVFVSARISVCLCAGDGHGLVQKENVQMQRRKL